MAAAVIQEPEAPEAARITQVEDLPDPVRADIVGRRQSGETLAELKTRFAHVDPAVIREVLPPANARERKQRTTLSKPKTAQEAAKSAKPVGGKATAEKTAEPTPAPEPRYASDLGDLPDRVVAARKVMGRKDLSAALGISESATWRAEQGRVHPGEVKALTDALAQVEERIAAGEFKKAEKAPKTKASSKAELEARIAAALDVLRGARDDKRITKGALIDTVVGNFESPATDK